LYEILTKTQTIVSLNNERNIVSMLWYVSIYLKCIIMEEC